MSKLLILLIAGVLCGISPIVIGILTIRHVFIVRNRTWNVGVEKYTFVVHEGKKAKGPLPYDWIDIVTGCFFVLLGFLVISIILFNLFVHN